MWSILENGPCALEKNVCSATLGCKALKISIKSICSSVSFKAAASLLIFFLEDLSVDVNGVLKIPYYDCITVYLSFYVHKDLLYSPDRCGLVVEYPAAKQKVISLILDQGTCLGCRFSPWLGCTQEAND